MTNISNIIIENAKKFLRQFVPTISDIIQRIKLPYPLENISAESDQNISCLSKPELEDTANLRNKLVDNLNSFTSKTKSLSKILDPLTSLANKTDSTINSLKNTRKIVQQARKVGSIAVKLVPAPPGTPGAVTSVLSDLAYIDTNSKEIIEDFLKPKLGESKGKISNILAALDYAKSVTFNTAKYIKPIDSYLTACGTPPTDLVPINDDVQSIINELSEIESTQNQEQQVNNQLQKYSGFTLEIVEEPFSSTVNRRKAVAKNASGIILLETPPSFTTNTKALIEQLKLIIDASNLKAY